MSGELALAINHGVLMIVAGLLVWWAVRKYYDE